MTVSEPTLRLVAFAAILTTIAVAELAAPRRPTTSRKRWLGNGLVVLVDTILVRIVFPTGAAGAALWAEANGFGLLNRITLPYWIAAVGTFLALDLVIYFQHRLFHAIPALWRLHRVHHTDTGFDFTTALRFHPIEILLSMVIKFALVIALGAPVAVVVAFEVVLNGMAMFNHGNFRIPPGLDRILRLVVVTPDMHRVHHSVYRNETDSNFGFNIAWWDRAFGTYRAQPRDGHDAMRIGLEEFREPGQQRIDRLLSQPFRAPSP